MRGDIFKHCHENERFSDFSPFCNTDKRNWGCGKKTKMACIIIKHKQHFLVFHCTKKKKNINIAFQTQIRNTFHVKINFALN